MADPNYEKLPWRTRKRFDEAHQTEGKGGKVHRIPVIPYDPKTEANEQ